MDSAQTKWMHEENVLYMKLYFANHCSQIVVCLLFLLLFVICTEVKKITSSLLGSTLYCLPNSRWSCPSMVRSSEGIPSTTLWNSCCGCWTASMKTSTRFPRLPVETTGTNPVERWEKKFSYPLRGSLKGFHSRALCSKFEHTAKWAYTTLTVSNNLLVILTVDKIISWKSWQKPENKKGLSRMEQPFKEWNALIKKDCKASKTLNYNIYI